jgi:8-amino-7-oxononanoate synthase
MDRIEQFQAQREDEGLWRALRPAQFRRNGMICRNGRELIDFSSNDYLSLSCHPSLIEAAQKSIGTYGTGSGGSRLLSGDLDIHHELEEKTALFKGKESAIVFNSGYQANIGIISALCKNRDAIFCDKLSHASIIDGALLSGARLFRFQHNDVGHLETLLKKTQDKFNYRLIVTESVFSMDGDIAPLKEMVELKEKYDCSIMVDEAHATGLFADNGSGIVAQEGLSEKIDFIMGTFSKALGSFGAYLACSEKIKGYLINNCRSFIYSTSLPPSVIAANIAAFEVIAKEPFRRETLLENAAFFCNELKKRNFNVRSQSQIIPIIAGAPQKAICLSRHLEQNGYFVPAIRPPTVPNGQSRLRFSLNYHHSREFLQRLIEEMDKADYV